MKTTLKNVRMPSANAMPLGSTYVGDVGVTDALESRTTEIHDL